MLPCRRHQTVASVMRPCLKLDSKAKYLSLRFLDGITEVPMMRSVLFAAAMVMVSGTAFAQDSTGGQQVKYKERTVIDFEGVDVTGELVKPSGALLLDRRKADFNPLIKLRTNFNLEMKQSVDQVK